MKIMPFNGFVHKYILKNKTTSNMKIQQFLSSLSLNYVGTYLRDGVVLSDVGIVNIHPSKGTHWVAYLNQNLFDSYGCVCPKKLSRFIMKRNGLCLFS